MGTKPQFPWCKSWIFASCVTRSSGRVNTGKGGGGHVAMANLKEGCMEGAHIWVSMGGIKKRCLASFL